MQAVQFFEHSVRLSCEARKKAQRDSAPRQHAQV
eukprot:CAMPEP_0117459076 /NCGR_PEP_ID=MMETSP0784-20121206/1275_1 /TAXON_ID=39447 /ORGANISM="" /LENGTH=33 /DNA_ID= /DNA_START= /DNA_END= /DNA_ORIENTATION=